MLDICLKLLAILGILLLILFGLFLLVLLLILFCPVTYRVRGRRDTESLELSVKIKWLAGFLSARYRYPEPGRIKVKLLCFPLYDMKIPPDKAADAGKEKASPGEETNAVGKNSAQKLLQTETAEEAEDSKERTADHSRNESEPNTEDKAAGGTGAVRETTEEGRAGTEEASDTEGIAGQEEAAGTEEAAGDSGTESNSGKAGKFFEKIKKIKYTIQGIYDKIKRIWENISYYTALLRDEDTKELFAHVMHVSGKALKSIRPRRIKADIVFGTGAPDTTGYLYGVYCMLTASMRKREFLVTPDFERRIFQGEFDLAGHVCMGILLLNGLRLLMDKKLHIFIGKIKKNKRKEITK
ncbi:MAG: DUF2953 domain-containing protein [Lachnospiraceae bacterium]|nr:DUF2953 domain-containing protein [Lachnospiraceae bacterium]